MKQRLVLSLIFGVLLTGYGFSQSITGAEYFYDTDPGIGSGIPITVSAPFDTVEQDFSIVLSDTLDPGYHWLYIRSRDANGRWSLAKGHLINIYIDSNPNMLTDQPDIAGVEYFIDTDTGVGMGTWIANSPAKDTMDHNQAISMTGLDPGYHSLYTRGRDVNGRWGNTYVQQFYIFEEGVVNEIMSGPPIVAAEYYFDDEVPFGKGTAIQVTKGDSVEWSGQIEVTGLEAGEHNLIIRVQDSVGNWSIAYAEPFSVVGLTSSTDPPTICQGSTDGTATVSISGGKPPFTFLWDDPENQTDSTATGLSAGFYTVTVQDAEGAVIKETVEIKEYDTIEIEVTTAHTDCKLSQGSANAVATGDNAPFKYLWTNGSDQASASGLSSGIYEVTVTDNIGCSNKAIAVINDIGGPVITVTEAHIQHLDCAGDADGIIAPEISGGTPPYVYSWSNGETTQGNENLKAGSYELTVLDANGCISSQSIRVKEPQPITYSISVVEADCGLATGAATLSVMGGSQPYAFSWKGEDPPHTATRSSLSAGVYEVTITDNVSCSAVAQVAIGEEGAPTVNVTSITQSTCGNTDGSILLAGGTGSFSYEWKDEAGTTAGTSKDLTGVGPGIYNVSVSDGSGCKTFATATIPAEQPPTEMICLVTVDTATNNNLVVWNETPGKGIVAYRLYRETTSAGVFDSIAYIPVDSLSQFSDDFADPEVRSWRYKLAAINTCGVESRLSPPHRTMHLTVSVGLLDRVNLLWNHYEGFVPYNSRYRIWRQTPGIGWETIDSVPSNTNSYTDKTPPDADLWYYIEAVHPNGCTPKKASTLNSSRSNRRNKLKSAPDGVNSFSAEYNLIVYPNPSEGIFKVLMEMERPEDLDIRVFDMSGKLMYLNKIQNVSDKLIHEIDLSALEKGLYQLNIQTEKGVYNRTIMKE